MATFVLIHGASHGGWCWQQVVALLEEAGHKALAPNLPGLGGDAMPHAEVTLEMTADFVADLLLAQTEPVILVGHSLGGSVISETAERIPEQIAGLVYVCAMLVPNGRSAMDCSAGYGARDGVQFSADGTYVTFDPTVAMKHFYNRTEISLAANAVEQLVPQPMGPVVTPVTLTEARSGSVLRAYVECSDDKSIPLGMQREMLAAIPCDPVFTLDADHSPFLSMPNELVDCLLAANATFTSARH